MGKFLFWLILGVVLWWFWTKRERGAKPQAPGSPPEQRMVACAHCGVFLPESEALVQAADHYCSEAHRLAGPKQGA